MIWKLHKAKFAFLFAAILIFDVGALVAQDADVVDKSQDYDTPLLRSTMRSSRGYGRFNKTAQNQGLQQFFRSTVLDGNLVTGAITNSGILSHAQLSIPPLSWPKGPQQVSYIFGTFFYFASEVITANGDTVAIVSDHYRFGEMSNDQTHGYYFMPLPKYYNLDQPDAQEIPLIGGISEDVGEDGIPRTNDPGEDDGILQTIEDFNSNGVLDLNLQNVVGWFATSNRKETWPEYWPAGTYPGDDRQPGEERPGVRAGRWNGEFGAFVRGDQESYFVMTDRENDEFEYFPFDDDTLGWPEGRRGLGIIVETRSYQWNARLAEDILINIYDITNEGKDLEKCVVGMLVDPDLGGQAFDDSASFDVNDDITFTWNRGGRTQDQGLPIGYFGFAFLESPGLANDGIDNDNDGLIDESQSNGIDDDNDWRTWEDENGNGVYDNEDLNFNGILDPGEDVNENGVLDIEPVNDDTGPDGLGPEDFEYSGPDEGEVNGIPDTGEPNFEFADNDESDQVGLTSWYLRQGTGGMGNDQEFWDVSLQPGTFGSAQNVNDIGFVYGSGFVRFAGNERTNRYAIALAFGNDFPDILRNKRTIQVIYDNDYSFAKPPLQPTLSVIPGDGRVFLEWDNIAERSTDPIYGKDFEAYYVYKSTDPTFTEIKTITDGFGNPLLFKAIAIYDLQNGLTDLHPVRLGSELGGDSDLGVSYNMGKDSGLQHFYVDEEVDNGRTYYFAVASVDQGYHPDFYPDISEKRNLSPISPTESAVNIQIDPLGRPISFDRNTAQVIPSEMIAGWQEPTLSEEGIEHVAGAGTGRIAIEVFNPNIIKSGNRYRVEFDDDGSLESNVGPIYTGNLDQMTIKNETENITLSVIPDPQNDFFNEVYIAEGIRVVLYNDSNFIDPDQSSWISGDPNIEFIDLTNVTANSPVPRDYEIRVLERNADSSNFNRPANFQIWDITDPDDQFKMEFFYLDRSEPGILDHRDEIEILSRRLGGKKLYEFKFEFPESLDSSDWRIPENGDTYKIFTTKTFDRKDAMEFTMIGNVIDDQKATTDLENIYVVPDPYIAVNRLERKVINPDEGRGERRIDFVNLPKNCTISIYSASGKFVQQILHSASEDNRRAEWDLRTKDGLEIAHGIYFYAVDAPGIGTKTGKFAIIK